MKGQSEPRSEPRDGRRRVVIEAVAPQIDAGRFPVKRTVGEALEVQADIFVDGHDRIAARLLWRRHGAQHWDEAVMGPLDNDRWTGTCTATGAGRWEYTLCAWVDHFGTWLHDLQRRRDPDDIAVALSIGAALIDDAAAGAPRDDGRRLRSFSAALRAADQPLQIRCAVAADPDLGLLMQRLAPRRFATTYERVLGLQVDPERARFSTWYELFPRSAAADPGRHGTFADVQARLPYIAGMGFDVLYLPPIHPIGCSRRKGPNNALLAAPDDPGSPWAIGAAEGGHKAVHPQLGTLADFRDLVGAARALGIEVALDIAYQCSPDHPYLREHPQWFRHRPDGSVQYAENPPKKYQDIYPFDFETEDWHALHEELASIVEFWIEQGVYVFRIDNPHTKPFPLWEWLIERVKARHPQTIFLAEAFTRPKVMRRLAKLGFTQSYTYFAWRNTKTELEQYFTELTRTDMREYFRPNLWPNTPDILTEYLQLGGRPAFITRLVLAATLGSSYGIYGPAFELLEHAAREPGSEEYLGSEKYQLRHWDLQRADSLHELIARVNRIRHENQALQHDRGLAFHDVDNEELICYSKTPAGPGATILVVVNLDPHHRQRGWVQLPLPALGIDPERPYQLHDLLSGSRFLWHGPRNYVELDPSAPAHILRLRRHTRSERDFDYFM